MTRRNSRWLGVGVLASASAGLLELASIFNPTVALGDDAVPTVPSGVDTALIMGYAGTSDPAQPYVNEVMSLFVDPSTQLFPGQPVYAGYEPLVQSTPEGADYGQVLSQGVPLLDQGITQQLAAGNDVVVFGYSESTSIASQEMVDLDALPATEQPNPADLSFVLVEDLNTPNGGFAERFPTLTTESFPATPADTPYATDIYNIEYSGSSDFPQYPLNLLADANAEAGFVDLHPFLLPDWPTGFSTSELAGAVLEPMSAGYDGNTDYFLIATQNLPLLDGLRGIPGVGPAMADMIQPDMRVLIDLGYDRTGPADVSTPAEWQLPDVDWNTVSAELALGAQQGMTAAQVDLGLLPTSDLPNLYPYLPDVSGLESGSVGGEASASAATSASSVPLEDVSAPVSFGALLGDLNTYLPGLTSDVTALLGSSATTDVSSLLSTDLLPGLAGLLTNSLDFLSF
jgi:diacyltrehalose acyltransferase